MLRKTPPSQHERNTVATVAAVVASLLLLLVATACGDTPEPEVIEKEVVKEVVVTPETPPGRELAQQAHNGDVYTVVEYDDRLAVFSGSGSPVTDPGLANDVLRSYAWGQVIDGLDVNTMADEVRAIRDVDDSLSGVRATSNEMVAIFDQLESLSASIPLLGRVSAMDVLAETYPGVDAASDAIRSLDGELNSIGRDSAVLETVVGHLRAVDPSGVTAADMETLFQDAVAASRDMEDRAASVTNRVAEVSNTARDLEDALLQVSNTPVIGDTIAESAEVAGLFADELSGIEEVLQERANTLASISDRFEEAIAEAGSAHRESVARWLQVPYDNVWRSVSASRPIAIATLPAVATLLPPTPTVLPTPTVSPSPTLTPAPTPTSVPTARPTPTDTPRPTSTPVPTARPTPTNTPEPTAAPLPTVQPTPTETPVPESAGAVGQIAFSSDRGGNWDVYVTNADASVLNHVTYDAVAEGAPSWSPDGLRITYHTYRDGNWEIYVINADSSGKRRLTDNDANDEHPSWSPDGQRIVFHSYRDGNAEVYAMNVDGSGVTRLTDNAASDWGPVWSPDGRRIAFASDREGNWDIYVMNADGSSVTQLTDNAAHDGEPSWSPDGSRITFASDRDGEAEIYVMNEDGSGVTRLTDNTSRDWYPVWSPDGRHIAFVSGRHGNDEIYVMNADGSGVIRLTDNEVTDWEPSWGPDYESTATPSQPDTPTPTPEPTATPTPEPTPTATPEPTPTATPEPPQVSFNLDWVIDETEVDAGESFTLTVRMQGVQGNGGHGGISVSFPSLTEASDSDDWYVTDGAEVEDIHYTTGLSRVTFHQPGATIYHRENNEQIRAEYLLVESDDPSWPQGADRTLILEITPRTEIAFRIQIRGWICADEYTDCSRQPSSGPTEDQQGWAVEQETVIVGSASTPTPTATPEPAPTTTPVAGPTAAPTATPPPTSTPISGNGIITSSRTYNAAIDAPGDEDEYTVVQESVGPIEIWVGDIPLAAPGSTNLLRVCPGWSRDCEWLADNGRYVWQQVRQDTYTIRVESTSEYNSFPYTIRVTKTKDDFAETGSAAHALVSGQSFSDAIRPDGDVDYFGIVQESVGPIEIWVGDIPLAAPGSTNLLRVCPGWSRDCEWFADNGRYVWQQVRRDTYTIRVESTSEYNSFPYTIRVTKAKDDFAETGSAAHALVSGQSFSDAIRPDGDVDYFGIVQESVGPIEIWVGDIPLAAPGSTNLLRVCPGWSRDCEWFADNGRYVWQQVRRDTYTIRVESTSEYNSFPYTIRVTKAKDDFAETGSAAHTLVSGQSFSDAIRPDGDVDYFGIVQESVGPIEIWVGDIPLAASESRNLLRVCPGWSRDCEWFADNGRYVWQQVRRDTYTIKVESTSEYNSFPYTITVTFNTN